MTSTIMDVNTELASDAFGQVVDLVVALRSELALFCLAFVLHQMMFGTLPRGRNAKKRASPPSPASPKSRSPSGSPKSPSRMPVSVTGFNVPPGLEGEIPHHSPDIDVALLGSQTAFERGDHKAVLRTWNNLRRSDAVPATLLAQVVESMQRLKKESSVILAEVQGYVRRNKSSCDITYVNELLASLAKSLDTALVSGIMESLPSLDMKPNSLTYEALIQMQFTTRSFGEVTALAKEMQRQGVVATGRTSLVLLKAALQTGHLEEAIRWFHQASEIPKHIVTQLVELACRERRMEYMITELEAARVPLSTEILNTMLTECSKAKDFSVAEHLQQMAETQKVELNGRSYQLLLRMAGNDRRRVSCLLAKMGEQGVECLQEAANSVISMCAATGDVLLADKLLAQVGQQSLGSIPTILALVRFYADAGEAEKACDVFEKYLKSRTAGDERRRSFFDAKTERCLITAALQCGRKDVAAAIVGCTPTDTAKHITMIRNCASQGKLDEALRIFDTLEAAGAELTHSLFNTALDACVECCDLKRAEGLMQRMVSAGIADAVSYNTLIKAHLRHSSFRSARNMVDEMRNAGCTPNHITYNELINYLVRSERDADRALVWEIIEEMKKNDVKPSRVTCSILFRSLKARSSQADITRAMELVDSMDEPMDEVLLSSVIEACVRIGKPGLLTEKLEQLQGKNCIKVTGAHTFGSLIKAYGCAHDMNGAWRCWKAMRSQRVRPTSITIGCMVEAVVTNGDVDGAYELLCQLLEDDECKEQVNAVVFGSVLKGFGRSGRMERVRAVFKEMLDHGIEPSIVTYNAVIDSCVRNSQVDAIPALVDDFKSRGLKPNLITYSTIIKGVCHSGDMSTAFSTLKELRSTPGLKPDDIVYNTMLDGCYSAGLCTEGEQLLQEMQSDGIAPNNYTLTVMVKLMGQARRVSRAFELVETITRKYRFRTNSHIYGALVQICISNRDLSRASETLEQAVRNRVQLDTRTCQNLFRSLIASGRAGEVAHLLRLLVGLPSSDGARMPATQQQGSHDSKTSYEGLWSETIPMLLDAGDAAAALAPGLLADARTSRPKLRVDAATDRRVKLATVKCSAPWR